MNAPIDYFPGNSEIPSAFYINGVLVAQGMTMEKFRWDFIKVHHDTVHYSDMNVLDTMDEVNANAKLLRLESYRSQLELNEDRVSYLKSMIDELENS